MKEKEFLQAITNKIITWYDISYQELSEKFIEQHFDKLDKNSISANQNLSEEFIEKHFDKLNIFYISRYQKLSESFIERYINKLDMGSISIYRKLSENFIAKHLHKLNTNSILKYQNLSENFLEKYFYSLNPHYIIEYQHLSEAFIEKYFHAFDANYLSEYQPLSEEFIENHIDYLNRKLIAYYQYISPEFRMKHNLLYPKYSWVNWTREQKEYYIKEYTQYRIHNGKVIAYKTCRRDGYSCYTFSYKYEVGGVYISHCDCNSDHLNSFGLSAWTRTGALGYYGDGKLFLVEIDLDDLGCVTKNGKKIRCRKLRILEEIPME